MIAGRTRRPGFVEVARVQPSVQRIASLDADVEGPASASAHRSYPNLPPSRLVVSADKAKLIASVKRRVPLPELVVADASTRFGVLAYALDSSSRQEDDGTSAGATRAVPGRRSDPLSSWEDLQPLTRTHPAGTRIRMPNGALVLLPPGIATTSPEGYAAARIAAVRKVATVVGPDLSSSRRSSTSPVAPPPTARTQEAEQEAPRPATPRHATVKVKALSRRVSIAAVLAAGANNAIPPPL